MFRKRFLPPVADLMAFEAAARHASISRAAEELHLTQSAVSRQIRQLEAQLGQALFARVRQRVLLTDAGRLYAADVRAVLQQLSAATQKAMALADGGGLLHLAVLPTLGARWLVPRLPDFAARHPEVTVNLSARTEPFDFGQEPFDAAIHYGAPHWAGAVCDFLMPEEVVPVCSPALLALRGPRFEQFAMIAQAAASGLGAALLPRFLVQEELASRTLVELPGGVLTGSDAYYLAVPLARAEAPVVRAFRDWMRQAIPVPPAGQG